jgi:hypothetical protein
VHSIANDIRTHDHSVRAVEVNNTLTRATNVISYKCQQG